MNADDRNPTSGQVYTPRQEGADAGSPPARRAFMPVTTEQPVSGQSPQAPASGQAPTRSPEQAQRPGTAPRTAAPTTGATPTTGSVPQRTAFRPQSAPQGMPTSRPVSTPRPSEPVAPSSTGVPFDASPSRFEAARGASTAALGAGTAKIKGLAGRAAESFKAGDDLATPSSKGGPRKARVLLSRIDPWSALKIGFLLSIAMGIMLVVAVFVLWNVLNGMGVFALVNEWVQKLFTNDQELNIMQFFDRNKVMSATILVSVVNVVLLTALATIGAFLYNVVSSVVGGIYVTLTDD